MLAPYTPIAVAAVLLAVAATTARAAIPPITGRDFDFSVSYESGIEFLTTAPPADILPAEDVVRRIPRLALTDPDAAGAGRDALYLAFVEVTRLPTVPGPDELIYAFPWIQSDLRVAADGTLELPVFSSRASRNPTPFDTGEVRNATLHVWRQTPELLAFIDDSDWPVFWQVARVWSNSTAKVSYDFSRANVDFKTRNATAPPPDDVNESAAPAEESRTSTADSSSIGCPAANTSATPSETSSETGTGGDSAAATTTGAEAPTETPLGSSASQLSLLLTPISMVASAILFFTWAI
ncbi:hypothetical protein GGS23DRAFT_479672 [Durotheca rogersii]|uniref:uncharacterized protein n=1 Tax=Durotheca rogersii TaxID=419775 RepID=UPI00221F52FF|nr:uncharacterized protein GGS23DRAFT_479672 [Durotheca rogersii]KAI5864040.1 hypothetical protein GGS23DRAFT_479672 [Durotheca rogersii]